MLIILEGPDGVGKSTLAQRIVTYLAVKYPRDTVELLHRGPPTRHPLDEYAVPLLSYRPGCGHHLVLDRWHWGEVVYPPAMRRVTKMTDGLFTYIEMLVKMRGGVVVNLHHTTESWKWYLDRGDEIDRTPGQIHAIAQGFLDVNVRSITGITPDETTPDHIVALAQSAEDRARPLGVLATPVATSVYRPDVLLLGDTRNCSGIGCKHATRHYRLGTAFMPYPATSGAFLLDALRPQHSDLLHRSFALANACDVDLPSLVWDKFNRPPIIALGRRAHLSLKVNGLDHATVPHPQYVRRFHHAAASLYGQLIWSLVGTERNELSWRPTSPREPVSASTRA